MDIKMKAPQSLKSSSSSEILMHVKKFMIEVIPAKDGAYFCYPIR